MSDWGISAYYDSSFGSADFWTQDPAATPTRDSQVADYHHDGGDNNTVIKLGRRTSTLELTVACNATDFATLEGYQDTSATLSYPAGGTFTAYLKAVSGKQHPFFTDIYEARLSFLI